jgi:hypothetical protein
MKRLDILREKLERLAKQDSGLEIFGADEHRYHLNPPLSEEELEQFESEFELKLPQDYRAWILNVGDGGAGPFYGLLPLRDNKGEKVCPGDASRIEAFYLNELLHDAATHAVGDEDYRAKRDAILETHRHLFENGIKLLAHEGCGMFSALVVKGEHRGSVWYIDIANAMGVFPEVDRDARPMSFFDWMETWLDASFAYLENGEEEFCSFVDCLPSEIKERLGFVEE